MMNKTKINYLTHTWNPLAMRCTRVDAGCANCWHIAMAKRLAKNPKLHSGMRASYAGEYQPVLCRWNEPMLRKTPSVVGVQFMGDIGHEHIEPVDAALVFNMMGMTQHHTYVVLTKRPERVAEIMRKLWEGRVMPNIWIGVSVHDQASADERIPILLQIPAAGHFVSYEPALSAVDFSLMGTAPKAWGRGYKPLGELIGGVIMGGESGPGARPMDPQWARDTRDQCGAAGTCYFMKQMGTHWARNTPHCEGGISVARLGDSSGSNIKLWPPDLLVRELPWEMPNA